MPAETIERWDEPDPHSVVIRVRTEPAEGLSLNERMVHRPDKNRRGRVHLREPLLDGAGPASGPFSVLDDERMRFSQARSDLQRVPAHDHPGKKTLLPTDPHESDHRRFSRDAQEGLGSAPEAGGSPRGQNDRDRLH